VIADHEIDALFDGDYRPATLLELPDLARRARVARVFVKLEGERPLGSFKMLGGMLAGLRALSRHGVPVPALICASDGNHGLAVAAAARRAGARAYVHLPAHVSAARAARIEAQGGTVVRNPGTYDDAYAAAAASAVRGDGVLISDTSPERDDPVVADVMDGYGLLARELVAQFDAAGAAPTHLFAQGGVGSFAAALAIHFHAHMRAPRHLCVVEPETAACIAHALSIGRVERIAGSLETAAEMLSCGEASAGAVDILRRHGARAIAVGDPALHDAVEALVRAGAPATTPSGAAGLAGMLAVAADDRRRSAHALDADSVVLLVATEGALPA
jgi:diaminopropionate ammonia-lyase